MPSDLQKTLLRRSRSFHFWRAFLKYKAWSCTRLLPDLQIKKTLHYLWMKLSLKYFELVFFDFLNIVDCLLQIWLQNFWLKVYKIQRLRFHNNQIYACIMMFWLASILELNLLILMMILSHFLFSLVPEATMKLGEMESVFSTCQEFLQLLWIMDSK